MSVEITRVDPGCAAPEAVGTVIVRGEGAGAGDVRFVGRAGPLIVYSSHLDRGDDLEQAVSWAVEWAERRKIGRIYVEAAPAAQA
jgi:hypothetical protein